MAIRARGAAFPSVLLGFPSAEALQLRTQFPASRAFLVENVACGEGVGREGGGGVSAGGAGATAVSCLSLYSLSPLHGFLFFHTTALRNKKLQDSRTGLAVGGLEETPGNTCKRSGCRLWKRQRVFVCSPGVILSPRGGSSSQICPKPGQGAVVFACSP